ncbi:hypothetical protein H9W90_02425 [Polaribacter pectinis]|uniref:Uncharacterized protein n=1 Tax=Polaribacter pectinis TaxID=2738844 RepID=A0A7G9LBJ0_9FLAO|nr:hypothetical protein [Polaribacter pectinis]QNM85989.1 hypothetical protein H9W90_02425 [Polaribacter pectinis]
MKFIWIDDESKRKKSSDNLRTSLRFEGEKEVTIDFIDVFKKDIDNILLEVLKGDEPDLVILDHGLTNAETNTLKKGSTVSVFLRETWRNCPVICVTSSDIEELDSRIKSTYDLIIPDNHIDDNLGNIISIVRGFSSLKSNPPENTNDLVKFFNVPKDLEQDFLKILPHNIKTDFSISGYVSELYQWCRDVFFIRPGFLYDRIWSSTFLGLNEQGFDSVEPKFEKAIYNGVFFNSDIKLWWKDLLLEIVNDYVDDVGFPWELGAQLVESKEELISKCSITGERFPETVAAEDETESSNWKPMKLRETIPHSKYDNILFFEELRVMNGL